MSDCQDRNNESLSQEAFGQISWLEVPVRDVDRAKKFYSEIFKWEFAAFTPPPVGDCVKSMHFFSRGKTLNGAFLEVDEKYQVVNHKEESPGALPILPTLCVLDCAKTLEQAKELGGKTALDKTEIGNNMGYFARVIDSEGNMIGIWSQN